MIKPIIYKKHKRNLIYCKNYLYNICVFSTSRILFNDEEIKKEEEKKEEEDMKNFTPYMKF